MARKEKIGVGSRGMTNILSILVVLTIISISLAATPSFKFPSRPTWTKTTTATQTTTTTSTLYSVVTQTSTTTTTTTVTTTSLPYSSTGCTDPAVEQGGITCSWLLQQAILWQPSSNSSVGWTVQFTDASYDNVENLSASTVSADLNMLLQTGATCIRIDIGYDAWLLNNVTAQNQITSSVNAIRADGKCLIIADAGANYYWQNPIPWSEFQTAWTNRVETLASLYHPNFYIVVKEPNWYAPMVSDASTNPQYQNVTVWSQLTQTLANSVQSVSPSTRVGISIDAGDPDPTLYTSYLSSISDISNINFVGFDIYTATDFANTQNYIYQSGLTKNIWISEAWSTLVKDSFSSDRASLDQLWIQDLYYFGLYIHATNISPFVTNCFSSYSQYDTSFTGRTPVFYEYQHLATSYDGYVQ